MSVLLSTALRAQLQKELREAFRDHRALLTAMLMAFLAPLMIYWTMEQTISDVTETPPIYIQIENSQGAAHLLAHLSQDRIFPLEQAPADQHNHWREKNIQLILPADHSGGLAGHISAGKPAEVVIRARHSDDTQFSTLRRLSSSLQSYNNQLAQQRLLLRGIDTHLLSPLDIQKQDTVKPQSNTGFMSTMLVMYLMVSAFFSSLPVAIDTSAGERERNVLELLLCQPISALQLVLAKLAVTTLVAVIGVSLTLGLSAAALSLVDLSQIQLNFSLGWLSLAQLAAILLPLCILAATLQLSMAFSAKSFKEAQSRVSLMIMLPAMLPLALMFIDQKPAWLSWAPLSGQYLMLESVLKGTPLTAPNLLSTSLGTLLLACLLIALLVRRLSSEKVVLSLG